MEITTKKIQHIIDQYSFDIDKFNTDRPHTPCNEYFDNLDTDKIVSELFDNNISLSITKISTSYGKQMLYCYINLFEWDWEPVCEVSAKTTTELTTEINDFISKYRKDA
jgi:hypothetical protein